MKHVTEFLLELGAGFAFVGRQVLLDVGGDEFFIDLLFYHLKLRCYVAIELKAGKFKPEHLGQLSFYLTAVDAQVKHPDDGPTIGLLLCKSKNKVAAEYALRDQSRPLGVAGRICLTGPVTSAFSWKFPSARKVDPRTKWHHDASMRTTINISDGILSELREIARRRRRPFREIVEETLQNGLSAAATPSSQCKPVRLKTHRVGIKAAYQGLSLNQLYDQIEAEDAGKR